ncbi:hypothetical protein HAX54_045490 [Datura stramonium]|uniref:Uncharacterized protein n=1 Tax=Datura stramonium TaxID=4076 RepID=A0ABS8SQK9_DATST|nr:hypothetical protein [Datura stramonium]
MRKLLGRLPRPCQGGTLSSVAVADPEVFHPKIRPISSSERIWRRRRRNDCRGKRFEDEESSEPSDGCEEATSYAVPPWDGFCLRLVPLQQTPFRCSGRAMENPTSLLRVRYRGFLLTVVNLARQDNMHWDACFHNKSAPR